MKVLIGYDGSESADAALDELNRAGLPADTEILVVAVGSIWMPPTDIASLPAEALASRRAATRRRRSGKRGNRRFNCRTNHPPRMDERQRDNACDGDFGGGKRRQLADQTNN
jgi:hypothetical protein